MIEKNADESFRTESAVDFDAYEVIFIHNFHYSSSYFSFVKFIFFNCILIFFKFQRDHDFFRNRLMIISIRPIFSCSEREKTIHNDKIKIMIADHTHAWAEIRTTYD